MQAGDVLLLEASEAGGVIKLRQGGNSRARRWPENARPHKRWIAAAALAAVVVVSALQILPIAVASLIAVVVVITARCVDAEEAYRAIDWPCLFLIAGMLALGVALEKTHTAEVIARGWSRTWRLRTVGDAQPDDSRRTSLLTEFLSNNAVAALLVPLAVEIANQLHANPRAFLIGVAFGASACFATPFGYQTNTLVFSAGGYRFGDFRRIGLPMNFMHWVLASLLVPLFWPL